MKPLTNSIKEIIATVVYPMIGPRCESLDLHDIPNLKEEERCLVCATYTQVDAATQSIITKVKESLPDGYSMHHRANWADGYNQDTKKEKIESVYEKD
jgi:anti-sigma factor RsiW